jgi:hypothetical protein
MTCGSSMLAMILSLPPQRAQLSISMPNRGDCGRGSRRLWFGLMIGVLFGLGSRDRV